MDIVNSSEQATAWIVFGIFLLFIELGTPLPTLGLAGLGALIALFLSSVFFVHLWNVEAYFPAVIVIPLFISASLLMVFIGYKGVKALRAKGPALGIDALLDKEGIVASLAKNDEFQIQVRGERWIARWHASANARANTTEIGARVRVVEQKGLVAYVVPSA